MSEAGSARPDGVTTIVFTDLDGTLLDRDTYEFTAALPALDLIRTRGVPVVLCSSKTRAEQAELRARLKLAHPFIVEDGSAIYLDRGYFPFRITGEPVDDTLLAIRMCPRNEAVRRALHEVAAETGIEITGFGDIDAAEVARLTGLDVEAAARAKDREFQESIVTPLTDAEAARVSRALAARGLRLTRGGRFYGATGQCDKGEAVRILAQFYRRRYGRVRLVGIGDSYNDRSMFDAVDVAVLVQKGEAGWEEIDSPGLVRAPGVGPAGWNRYVLEMLGAAT